MDCVGTAVLLGPQLSCRQIGAHEAARGVRPAFAPAGTSTRCATGIAESGLGQTDAVVSTTGPRRDCPQMALTSSEFSTKQAIKYLRIYVAEFKFRYNDQQDADIFVPKAANLAGASL
jgi:hypothetical protein